MLEEIANADQAWRISSLSALAKNHVKVPVHDKLNQKKGTIRYDKLN